MVTYMNLWVIVHLHQLSYINISSVEVYIKAHTKTHKKKIWDRQFLELIQCAESDCVALLFRLLDCSLSLFLNMQSVNISTGEFLPLKEKRILILLFCCRMQARQTSDELIVNSPFSFTPIRTKNLMQKSNLDRWNYVKNIIPLKFQI